MVPIYGHRYLPAGRGSWGHPILSIWQTDIICYGNDLADYMDRELRERTDATQPAILREATVDFWRDYL
jgi:hypothetical protein